MTYLKKIILYIFLLTFFVCFKSEAQNKSIYRDYRFFEIRGHSGSHLYTGKSLKGALENGYGAVQVRYGWQSNNPDSWQSMYLYPDYGFGWYSGFIGNPELLGSPGALYGFISFPLFGLKRHQVVLEPALGLSYDLKPYDSETNVLNDAIGSRFNVYFNLNIGAKYSVNREIDLLYGLDLTHFSNGRTFRPNAGLNMLGFNLGFRYNFNSQQRKVDNSLYPSTLLQVRPVLETFRTSEPIKKSKVQAYVAGGLVQNDEDKGTYAQYPTFTSWLEYQYLLNSKSTFVAGINFFYDKSLKVYYENSPRDIYGVHIGYDFNFWRMGLRFQLGSYLHERGHDMKGHFFFRPALKYDIGERFFLQLGLKTRDGFKADWIEYGVGITLW